MKDTSAAYKALVYSVEYARHFVPSVLIKVIDTNARPLCNYSSASNSFMTKFQQLINDVMDPSYAYGTLEDGLFNLGGHKRIIATDVAARGEVGYWSDTLCDADGNFSPALEALICSYLVPVSTVGRTILFDSTVDTVPKDFDIIYSRTGIEIARAQVRGNTQHVYTSTLSVQRYDKMVLLVYSMSKGYRRVKITEDIPGVYVRYDEKNIVSMTYNHSVDIFSKEIIAGEIDISVENASKILDILNPVGFEQYLQRRQAIEIYLNMTFPDGTVEPVFIGNMALVDWKSNKGALAATFTARDDLDKLALDEYIKGVVPTIPVSMASLAEAVLIDAGVTNYVIDSQLLNIYTNACLPIASHKELLRMIAQASQSVVLPIAGGGIHLKYFSPLLVAYNKLLNPCFNTNLDSWTQTGVTLSGTYVYYGTQSAVVNTGASLVQGVTFETGHKYYIKAFVRADAALTTGTSGIYIADALTSVNFVDANLVPGEWGEVSIIYEGGDGTSKTVGVKNNGTESFNIGAVQCVDLTLLYMSGNEPDKDWCDLNIRFFVNASSVPRVSDPDAVDTIDYSILMDAPEIGISEAVKSVETNIYNYIKESATSEIYKGTRIITGTEEFTIKFNTAATSCTIAVQSLDDAGNPTTPNTATLVSSTIYAQAAVLKVIANCTVRITVTGYKVNTETSAYRVDSNIDASLIPDATAQTIDNRLITQRVVAEDVTAYASYWYKRRYRYDFDWRQNPAVENLDTVFVEDDFDRKHKVLLTEKTLEYNGGVVSGASKGVY